MTRLLRRIERRVMLVAFSVVVVLGCGDPLDPEPVEKTYSWSVEQHGLASGLWFTGVWGISDNLFFVIGDAYLSDVLIKYENGNWTYIRGPRDAPSWFYVSDIHVLPSGYGYAVCPDYCYEYLNDTWSSRTSYGFTAVWADGYKWAWAATAGGKIWTLTELDGWYEVFSFPGKEFTDICRIGNQGFAVGLAGAVVDWTGEIAASEEDSGTLEDLNGVWGDAPDAVLAVGANGTVIRFDGEMWRPLDSGVSESLLAVWGTSSSDVFAVGEGGTILHYDGNRWKSMKSNVQSDLTAVWGTSSTTVFAVGAESTILRYGPDAQE